MYIERVLKFGVEKYALEGVYRIPFSFMDADLRLVFLSCFVFIAECQFCTSVLTSKYAFLFFELWFLRLSIFLIKKTVLCVSLDLRLSVLELVRKFQLRLFMFL